MFDSSLDAFTFSSPACRSTFGTQMDNASLSMSRIRTVLQPHSIVYRSTEFRMLPAYYSDSLSYSVSDKLFKDYNVHQSIDTLHTIVSEAKDRKSQGNMEHDTWKPDLDPKVAVCSRMIPVLTFEAERLKAMLAEVEHDNSKLKAELQEEVQVADHTNDQVLDLLRKLDSVFQKWQQVPLGEIEAWTVQSTETLRPILHS